MTEYPLLNDLIYEAAHLDPKEINDWLDENNRPFIRTHPGKFAVGWNILFSSMRNLGTVNVVLDQIVVKSRRDSDTLFEVWAGFLDVDKGDDEMIWITIDPLSTNFFYWVPSPALDAFRDHLNDWMAGYKNKPSSKAKKDKPKISPTYPELNLWA